MDTRATDDPTRVNLLWTGGWDSTFRLLQLLLSHRVPVVPYDLEDPTRASTRIELDTMARITAHLRDAYPHTRELLHPLRIATVHPADVRVPGLRRTVRGVALTVVVSLRWYGPRDPIVFRHTFHLIPVHGRWTWLLSPSRYRLYARGACGARDAS